MLHVITRMILGGAQENTLLSVLGTDARRGWRAELASGPSLGAEGELFAELGERRAVVHDVPSLRRAVNPLRDAVALLSLWWLCVRLRPAVVHTHSSKAGILGRVAARLAGVPVVVHTIHGLPFHEYQGRAERVFYVLCERLCARFADRILVVAEAMSRKALAAGVGYPQLYCTVYSGMMVEPFIAAGDDPHLRAATRAALGIAVDDVVVVLVARLFELKGHDDLLTVAPGLAAAIPSLRILFVGDGPRRQEIQERARALGIARRVTFAGLIPPARIPACFAAADLLVHTSLREGLARVLPQALLSGLPAVSYDIDGAREALDEGRLGTLVAPGDVATLESECLRILQDLSAARTSARRGREACRERFAASAMVDHLLCVYQRELAEPSPGPRGGGCG